MASVLYGLGPGAMLYKLSYEATWLEAGQFVGLLCSCERTDE